MLESPKAVIEKKIYKPNDQFIKSIRGLYLTLNFFGIWPRNVSTNWYKLIWFFHSACFVFHVFGPMAGLIVQRRDTEKVIENLGLLIPATCIFIEWFTFATRRIPVKKLLCSMEEDWVKLEKGTLMSQSVPDSNRIMASYSRSAKIFFYTYVGMLMLGVVNYVIDCTSARKSHDNDTDIDFDKVLPVPHSWYPLDYSRESNIQVWNTCFWNQVWGRTMFVHYQMTVCSKVCFDDATRVRITRPLCSIAMNINIWPFFFFFIIQVLGGGSNDNFYNILDV